MPVSRTAKWSRRHWSRSCSTRHFDEDFAVVGEFDGVSDQVDDDLPQAIGIADHRAGHVGAGVMNEFQALLGGVAGADLQGIADDLADVELDFFQLQAARLDLREVENVVEQMQQRIGGLLDDIEITLLLSGQRSRERQFGHADDAVHGRADFMAHRGQELALGLAGRLGGGRALGDPQFERFVELLELLESVGIFQGRRRRSWPRNRRAAFRPRQTDCGRSRAASRCKPRPARAPGPARSSADP